MMRLYTLLVFCLLSSMVSAQHQSDFWLEIEQHQMQLPADLEPAATPEHYRLYWLDMDYIRQTLSKAPAEFSGSNREVTIQLPTPDGTTETFAVRYSPVMMPKLAAKYPMIRSFSAKSLDREEVSARIVYSDRGLSVSVLTPKGITHLAPYSLLPTDYHMVYNAKDIRLDQPLSCGADDSHVFGDGKMPHLEDIDTDLIPGGATLRTAAGDPVNLRVYRLANAATGEFTRAFGNTVAGALAAIVTAANRLNQTLEKELAIRFMLIDDTDRVIFKQNNDKFVTTNDAASLLGQNVVILNDTFGLNNYDVGHVFTGGCINNLGGIAQRASACTVNKGRGVTCFRSSNIDNIVSEIMAHEIGHQFAASHSWNNCPPSIDQRQGTTAYEPGSGSTIMSYSGSCENQNIAFSSDDYYHVGSLVQMYNFIQNGDGGTCGTLEATNNTAPDVVLPYTNGFSIPISTPFRLEAEGSDMDGDQVLYCWEQYDAGPIIDITQANNSITAALFRSYPPTASSERIFPRLSDIVANTSTNAERLPIVSRDLTFRCTVRDWVENGGGVSWEEMRFKSTTTAGPFLVSQPNTSVSWKVGEEKEITWDVANTDNSTVNCQLVNIRLSINGGNTFPITLAENVPNDGSHLVIIPNNPTLGARIMVEAADNIFFDISNNDFTIQEATEPGIFFSVTPLSQSVCLPGDPTIDVELASLAGFNESTTLEVTGLPDGAIATWSSNPATPSEGVTLSVDMSNVTVSGTFPIDITATAPNLSPITRTISLILISNDFSALVPNSPINGASGISKLPSFEWVDVPNAEAYTIEIASSADFNAGSIFETATNITGNSYTLNNPLTENTPYYWRIYPINECNTNVVTPTFAFQTESVICLDFTNDEDINISSAGLPVEESTIEVPSGVISDVNVVNIDMQHDRVRDVKGELVSPTGTRVLLFDEPCGGTRDIDVGFDDEAAEDIICPPTGSATYKPLEMLSAFNTENSEGTWRFVVSVTDNFGNGGFIDSWTLQTCGNLTLDPPILVKNDTLGVPPGSGNDITQNILLAEDANNTAEELTFTLINPPSHGIVRFQGDLNAAGAWSQANINSGSVSYKHDGSDTEFDSFVFSVSDGEGGWLMDTMNIEIDSRFTSSVNTLDAQQYLQVFPVPADQQLNIRFLQSFGEEVQLSLYDIQGRQLQRHFIGASQASLQMSTHDLASGMYFLQVVTNRGIISQKVSIAH